MNYRIALFGTSADPPTAGHQEICRWLGLHYDWVAVWASDNPFKSHQTPLAHRSMMLSLMLEELRSPNQSPYQSPYQSTIQSPPNLLANPITNIDLHQDLSSPRTLETVAKAQHLWGQEADLTVVIGSDLIPQLSRWYRITDLLQQVQLLVIPRSGYPLEDQDLQELKLMGGKITIAHVHPPDVSSTDYREYGDRATVTPPIADYINRENLYSCQNLA